MDVQSLQPVLEKACEAAGIKLRQPEQQNEQEQKTEEAAQRQPDQQAEQQENEQERNATEQQPAAA